MAVLLSPLLTPPLIPLFRFLGHIKQERRTPQRNNSNMSCWISGRKQVMDMLALSHHCNSDSLLSTAHLQSIGASGLHHLLIIPNCGPNWRSMFNIMYIWPKLVIKICNNYQRKSVAQNLFCNLNWYPLFNILHILPKIFHQICKSISNSNS